MNRSRIDALIMEQEQLSCLTRADIKQLQLQKLNNLLQREKERSGFYRALPERLGSLDELRKLPFTTDEDLAENAPGLLLCSQSMVSRVLSDATSGTTGSAKRVFYTEADCARTVELFKAGLGELIFPGSRTMICFPFSGPFGLGELISEAVTGLGAVPLKLGAGLSYGDLSAVLVNERPDTFVGMPSRLLSILRVCGKGTLRRALVSGDACPDSVTAACEELLGSELFPHYGSREMALGGAITCPAHSGMHLRENHVIAEIVDPEGNTLPQGGYGELVITTIGMEAMPLIRYKTGDHTRILPERCACGSEVIRLDKISRDDAENRMSVLDEQFFALPYVADLKAQMCAGRLKLTVLTCGEGRLPDIDADIECRPVSPDDSPLYYAKRKIEVI